MQSMKGQVRLVALKNIYLKLDYEAFLLLLRWSVYFCGLQSGNIYSRLTIPPHGGASRPKTWPVLQPPASGSESQARLPRRKPVLALNFQDRPPIAEQGAGMCLSVAVTAYARRHAEGRQIPAVSTAGQVRLLERSDHPRLDDPHVCAARSLAPNLRRLLRSGFIVPWSAPARGAWPVGSGITEPSPGHAARTQRLPAQMRRRPRSPGALRCALARSTCPVGATGE